MQVHLLSHLNCSGVELSGVFKFISSKCMLEINLTTSLCLEGKKQNQPLELQFPINL